MLNTPRQLAAAFIAVFFLLAFAAIGHHEELPFQRYAASLCKVKSTVVAPTKVKPSKATFHLCASQSNDRVFFRAVGFVRHFKSIALRMSPLPNAASRAPPSIA